MVGNIVKVNDVGNGVMKRTGILQDKKYIVLAVNCDLPRVSKSCFPNERNDTVIQEIVSKDVIFIQKRFLDIVHSCNKCPKCGADI